MITSAMFSVRRLFVLFSAIVFIVQALPPPMRPLRHYPYRDTLENQLDDDDSNISENSQDTEDANLLPPDYAENKRNTIEAEELLILKELRRIRGRILGNDYVKGLKEFRNKRNEYKAYEPCYFKVCNLGKRRLPEPDLSY